MGEAELISDRQILVIRSVFYFYGDAANAELARQVAMDIESNGKESGGRVRIKNLWLEIRFEIAGIYKPGLTPLEVYENTDPRNNYFRIEEFVSGNISFVDAIGSNTGYFKLDNLLHNSTTAAHEY